MRILEGEGDDPSDRHRRHHALRDHPQSNDRIPPTAGVVRRGRARNPRGHQPYALTGGLNQHGPTEHLDRERTADGRSDSYLGHERDIHGTYTTQTYYEPGEYDYSYETEDQYRYEREGERRHVAPVPANRRGNRPDRRGFDGMPRRTQDEPYFSSQQGRRGVPYDKHSETTTRQERTTGVASSSALRSSAAGDTKYASGSAEDLYRYYADVYGDSEDQWHHHQFEDPSPPRHETGGPSMSSSAAPSSYDAGKLSARSQTVGNDLDFARLLERKRGWKIVPMAGDGACLFRAIAYHVYSDQEMHDVVRTNCIKHMRAHRSHFKDFIAGEDFDHYLERKSLPHSYGNHPEIQAMSELYNRTIEIYSYSLEPINIFQAQAAGGPPIRLSYCNQEHYDAIVDPSEPAFGVGLGLPGLDPKEQARESERRGAEEQLVQQYQSMSDMEQTQRELEEQVLLQSQLDYLHQLQQQRQQQQGSTSSAAESSSHHD